MDALKSIINYPARVKCAVHARTALQNGLEKGGSQVGLPVYFRLTTPINSSGT